MARIVVVVVSVAVVVFISELSTASISYTTVSGQTTEEVVTGTYLQHVNHSSWTIFLVLTLQSATKFPNYSYW